MKNIFDEKIEEFKKSSTQTTAEVVTSTKDSLLSFVAPIETVDLPSKGYFYDPRHPLHHKSSLEIKQMTAKEEDILTNKGYIKKGILIDKLLESILIDKTIPVSSLLLGDKNAIMVAARISAYGPNYDVGVLCTECGEKNLLNINLHEIESQDIDKITEENVKNLNLEIESLIDGKIFIKLPKTKWTVECKYMTGAEERQIFSMLESRKKIDPNSDLAISEQLKFIVCGLNGSNNEELIKSAIDIMPAGDAKLLRSVYQKIIPDIKIKKVFSCRSCFKEQETEVPFTQEFFWPK